MQYMHEYVYIHMCMYIEYDDSHRSLYLSYLSSYNAHLSKFDVAIRRVRKWTCECVVLIIIIYRLHLYMILFSTGKRASFRYTTTTTFARVRHILSSKVFRFSHLSNEEFRLFDYFGATNRINKIPFLLSLFFMTLIPFYMHYGRIDFFSLSLSPFFSHDPNFDWFSFDCDRLPNISTTDQISYVYIYERKQNLASFFLLLPMPCLLLCFVFFFHCPGCHFVMAIHVNKEAIKDIGKNSLILFFVCETAICIIKRILYA